jgi:hypothetical protein
MIRLRLVTSGLAHRPIRTLLLATSMVIAIATFNVGVAVRARIAAFANASGTSKLVVRSSYSGGTLPWTYLEQVRRMGLQVSGWFRYATGRDRDGRYEFTVAGVDDDYPQTSSPSWFRVDADAAARWRANRRGLLVAPRTAETMHWTVGQRVQFESSIGVIDGEVLGIASGMAPGHVVAHGEYLDALRPQEEQHRLDAIAVTYPPGRGVEMARAIDASLERSVEPTRTALSEELVQAQVQSMSALPELLWRVSLLMLLVTSVVAITTISTSMLERRTELTTLRAIGFRRVHVALLVLIESELLALGGGLVGAALVFFALRHDGLQLGEAAILSNVTLDLPAVGRSLLVALGLGLVVGVWPAFSASRRDIVAALRAD